MKKIFMFIFFLFILIGCSDKEIKQNEDSNQIEQNEDSNQDEQNEDSNQDEQNEDSNQDEQNEDSNQNEQNEDSNQNETTPSFEELGFNSELQMEYRNLIQDMLKDLIDLSKGSNKMSAFDKIETVMEVKDKLINEGVNFEEKFFRAGVNEVEYSNVDGEIIVTAEIKFINNNNDERIIVNVEVEVFENNSKQPKIKNVNLK